MKRWIVTCVLCLTLMAVAAWAAHHEIDQLVELDKKWGSAAQGEDAAAVLGEILADDLLAIDVGGVVTKADMLEATLAEDAPTGPYMAGDYVVRFLSDDIAVMLHSAGEPDPHWSLHVWQMKDGRWQVVASASSPIEE